MNNIFGVSLGPGDPELITVKALRVLRESDLIFYPGSIKQDGRTDSYVRPMLDSYGLAPENLQGFYLNMNLNRSVAEETYRETASAIVSAWSAGKKVSIVCEGDLSFYASFSYLLEKLQQLQIPLELIPGINSFSLAAARHQIPLCLQREKLGFLPLEASMELIEEMLHAFDTLVLMKVRIGWKHLYPRLLESKLTCYYAEKLGTADEFISTSLKELKGREIPYFSLLIIKK